MVFCESVWVLMLHVVFRTPDGRIFKELYLNRVVGQFGFLYGISVHSELNRHSILFSSRYKIKPKQSARATSCEIKAALYIW